MQSSESSRDNRKHARYPLEVRVRICFSKSGFLQRANVKAMDIGANGLSISSPLELPEDSPVEVEMTLPGQKAPMRVKAVIRNHRGVRYGVEFLSTTDVQKQDITQFGNGRKPSSSAGAAQSSLPAVN